MVKCAYPKMGSNLPYKSFFKGFGLSCLLNVIQLPHIQSTHYLRG